MKIRESAGILACQLADWEGGLRRVGGQEWLRSQRQPFSSAVVNHSGPS